MSLHFDPQSRANQYFMVTWLDLLALGQYREHMEASIARLVAERGEVGWVPPQERDPGNVKAQLIQGIVDNSLPQVFRRSYLLNLWAVFESGVTIIARTVATFEDRSPPNLSAPPFLPNAVRYYSEIIELPLFSNSDVQSRLELLARLRSAFIHGNGLQGSVKRVRWVQIEQDSRRFAGLDTSRGAVEVDAEFVEKLSNDVRHAVINVIGTARQRLVATGRPL